MQTVDHLIIGGGPCGLGAALRLQEEGADWRLLEAEDHFGGLASSFVDDQGFTWDLGGHVHFSHYDGFDRYLDLALGVDGWLSHERESWVWMRQRFIPYPFQNNVHRLPPEDCARCVAGLKAAADLDRTHKPANFEEWMAGIFGSGITEIFMRPYNFKVWAYPPSRLAWNWIGERVAVPDYAKLLADIRANKDDRSWGPNNTFQFPKHGGTGSIYEALGCQLPSECVSMKRPVVRIDADAHTVTDASGAQIQYGRLITTMPLNRLIETARGVVDDARKDELLFSSVNVVGIGIEGTPPKHLRTKCWMYFPETHSPYYRVTMFSNYSPNNVARPGEQWSLMAEVSESPAKPVDHAALLEDVISAAVVDRLIPAREQICSTVVRFLPQAYPTPFLGRDSCVDPVLRTFESRDIYSRGRFGAWKYEVGNEDHSFAQGYECVERLLSDGGAECEPTLHSPALVNSRRNP